MCARQVTEEKRIDILTLMRELHKKGYELVFSPGEPFSNCVSIILRDANVSRLKARQTKILVKVDRNCFLEPNTTIFEIIEAMIEDMEHYTNYQANSNPNMLEDIDVSGLIDE